MAHYLLGEDTDLIHIVHHGLMPSPGYSLPGSSPDAEHSSVTAEDNNGICGIFPRYLSII